jgi:hypothetical protein
MVATTVYHELRKRLLTVLTTHHCGASTRQALTYNFFLSGFSVMLGAVIILALELS